MKYVQIARDYYWFYGIICVNLLSPLAIAEWIEIVGSMVQNWNSMSPLAIAEWIEIEAYCSSCKVSVSPLAIAEWIEISVMGNSPKTHMVSASDSGVD